MAGGRRCCTRAAAAAVMLSLAGCGSDGPGTCGEGQTGVPPNCVALPPPPPACTQTSIHTNSGAAPPRTLLFFDFPVPESGRLDMTADWTFATSQMGFYLVPAGTCTLAEFNARSCNFLVRSEPPGPKPRKVSATNLPAGNYRYLLATFSDETESAAVQIVLSKGSCPAFVGLPPSALARGDEASQVFASVREWR